ncbi:hypothetical protein GOFOIKOB_3982 [Methylobacterium tardum]|uniref:Uncharacterized protein n=1 Tax=Methylobacterium tardum TaxID=374432 RepID=A0AA37TAM6_9HYPH|nr:hypothetical protein [Methylobacterium tardum]URD38147.1 hypothetical protein M6G65_06685 [Methylobacterium tardum]GJE50928.1 hypothetical protein GOFOIKOB_3982 [Methylobacterium tardum]GLS69929.1 hypothetical protein GCM10007890_19420 [Methylobacterium tardum]
MVVKAWTLDRIRELPESAQRTLYERAKTRADGDYIIALMDDAGLKPKPKLMSYTDPVYRQMVQIGKSSSGKAAMEAAAAKGEPALCGFDRLLQSRLGEDYSESRCPGTIMSAGSIVAEIMPKLGYVRARKSACVEGCMAREGIVWLKG